MPLSLSLSLSHDPGVRARVTTRWSMPAAPDQLWPLLSTSRMHREPGLLQHLGVPVPRSCRLLGPGRLGQGRECSSDRGVIRQRILRWEPDVCLRLQMVGSTLPQAGWLGGLVEELSLVPTGAGGCQVVRTTSIRAVGRFALFKALALLVGIKLVHRFVFQNWQDQLLDLGREAPEPRGLVPRLELVLHPPPTARSLLRFPVPEAPARIPHVRSVPGTHP